MHNLIFSANVYGSRSAFSWSMRVQGFLSRSGDHTDIVSHQWKQEQESADLPSLPLSLFAYRSSFSYAVFHGD
jgi:hypothetical protein